MLLEVCWAPTKVMAITSLWALYKFNIINQVFTINMPIHCSFHVLFVIHDKALAMLNIILYKIFLLDIMSYNITHLLRL